VESASEVGLRPAVRANVVVYAIDGALLGLFMVSACASVALLEHPLSALHAAIPSAFARRALIGLAMGLTALALIYSPWGKRSGAFMNPAMVLSFLRLGRLSAWDALGYIAAQLVGSALGVGLCALALGRLVSHAAVNYVVTMPGPQGEAAACLAEFTMGFVLLSVVMTVNRVPRLSAWAGVFAATLVMLFITFEAPISGMSLNPARSFGSALIGGQWRGFWIYLSAPVAGMLAGVELQRLLVARSDRLCGKLNHSETIDCFVRCECSKAAKARP
jgi:aquaporin Z